MSPLGLGALGEFPLAGSAATGQPAPPAPPVAERFQYLELRSAIGGACLGFMNPIGSRRRRSVNGDDAFSFNVQADHRLVPQIEKGKIVREILSVDGATWREWEVKDYRLGVTLMFVECRPIMEMLKAFPIHLVDGDGYVYTDAPAIQLPPATMITARIRSTTPSWLGTGTVTPTALGEVPFSGDNARSGLLRMEEVFPPYNASLRWAGSQYLIDFTQLGLGAPPIYLRDMKNIVAIEKRTTSTHINRLTQIRGADGDYGPSGIGWAYWEIETVTASGPDWAVKLKAIHGGDGPIKFDDQFNHANLPGGAQSLYLEDSALGYHQILDTVAATQTLVVSTLSGLTAGHRCRIVASSTGKQLTFLDAPAEIALYGLHPGAFESGFDDTHTVNKNALQIAWAVPGGPPDGWTGVGSRTTTPDEFITAGQALLVNQSVADGVQVCAPPAASVKIRPRQTKWSATCFIRLRAAFVVGSVTFQVKANGVVVGAGWVYGLPNNYTVNAWRQLQLRGLDLSPYVGTTVTLVPEIIKSGGAGTVNMCVDDICLTPTVGERAPCEGSNDARTHQEANRFLEDARASYLSWPVTDADLARNGVTAEAGATLGGTVVMETAQYGSVTARILQISDVPEDPAQGAQYEVSTLPPRFSRAQVKPADLIIPYLVPIEVTTAATAEANAALICKVITPFTQTPTQITVNLTVMDTRGGTPGVTAVALGGATIASGSGAGPWVINRPAAGAGVGRVVWTATLSGRTDQWDAVDVPEQEAVAAAIIYTQCDTLITAATATQVTVMAFGTDRDGGGPATIELSNITNVTLLTGPAIGVPQPGPAGATWTFSRPIDPNQLGFANFKSAMVGAVDDYDAITIGPPGSINLLSRARVLATSATSVTVRVAVADPIPQGTNSATINYQKFPASLAVDLASGLTVTPAATLTEAANTYKDYVITRPGTGTGTARITFTTVAANRVDDTDSVDVPAQEGVLYYTWVAGQIISSTATQVILEAITVVTPVGWPTVELSMYTGVTLAAGPGIGVPSASGQQWTFNRPTDPTVIGQVRFRSNRPPDAVDDYDVVFVGPPDVLAVQGRARVITSNDTTVVVRVVMADPVPQGASSGTITWVAILGTGGTISPASGQVVTPTATLVETTPGPTGNYKDFTISRPNAGQGAGQVVFTFTAAGRTVDTDPVIIVDRPPKTPSWAVKQTTESDTSVTVEVEITYDPEARVTGVEFASQTGQAAVSSFVLDSVAPFTKSVTLIEGQPSKVFYRVKGTFTDGSSGVLGESFVTVKPSAMPTPPILTLQMDSAGAVTARIEGDDLTQSIKVTSSLSSMPSDGTCDGATAVNFRQLTTATLQTVNAANPTCYVKVVAHSGTSGGGLKSIYVQGILTYTKVVTKTIRVPYGEFVPAVESYPFSFGLFGLHTNNSSGTEYAYVAPVVLPKGVTITNVSFRWRRATASEVVKVKFYKTVDQTPTLLVSQDPVSGTGDNTTSLSLSQLVADENYVAVVLMSATSGLSAATIYWIEVTYSTPSYEVTY